MASITQPARRSEDAMCRYLLAASGGALNGVKVTKRFDDEELGPNRLGIFCRKVAREQPESEISAGFVCDVVCKLTTHAGDTTGDQHDDICGAVWDAMMDPDALANINQGMSGEPFQAVLFRPPEEIENSVDGKRYVSEMTATLHMVPWAAA